VLFKLLAALLNLGIKLFPGQQREWIGRRLHDPRDRLAFDTVQKLVCGGQSESHRGVGIEREVVVKLADGIAASFIDRAKARKRDEYPWLDDLAAPLAGPPQPSPLAGPPQPAP
jgi:hypothetical protein